MDKVLGIIQARMGSKRLPGKVMMEIKGKPLIGYLLDRVAQTSLDGVVVASPLCDASSPLADYVHSRGVVFVAAGEEDDVAGRFLTVLDEFPMYDAFLRMCGDSPLILPEIIESAAQVMRSGSQFTSNVSNFSEPGMHVEGLSVDVYRQCEPYFDEEDREHAGLPWFYRNQESDSWVVDTQEDFDRIKRYIEDAGIE